MPQSPRSRPKHSRSIRREAPPLTMAEALEALKKIEHGLLTWAAQWHDGLPPSARARLLRIANTATRALARVRNPPSS